MIIAVTRRSWLLRGVAAVALVAAGVDAVRLLLGGPGMHTSSIVFIGVTCVYVVAGVVLTERRPGNAVGPIVFLIGLCVDGYVAADALVRSGSAFAVPAALLVSELDTPIFLLAGLLFLLFPDGRPPSPGWRWVAIAGGVLTVITIVTGIVRPGLASYYPSVVNPFGMPDNPVGPLWDVAYQAMILITVLCAASLVTRWRHADPVLRAQLKWVTAAAVLVAVGMLCYALLAGPGGYSELGDVLVGFGFASVPVAITIAILRYRLWEIDRLISRTLGWAIASGILLAGFAGAIVALQAVLAGFTQGQTLAVAASTLLAFAAFQPVRRRVQSAVDLRFNRARYDAQRTADAFGERLRGQVAMDAVALDLQATIEAAVRPAAQALWLRSGAGQGARNPGAG